jgi:hypothetical protein
MLSQVNVKHDNCVKSLDFRRTLVSEARTKAENEPSCILNFVQMTKRSNFIHNSYAYRSHSDRIEKGPIMFLFSAQKLGIELNCLTSKLKGQN